MSIQGNYNFNGIVVPAIGIVANIRMVSQVSMAFQLPLYASQSYVDAEQPFTAPSYEAPYDPAGGDVFSQAYAYVLARPEFASFVVVP
jgi:hypothetical protein